MDSWIFILPDDTESTALQVLAAVGEAGATRTDLCASFQLLPREIGRGSQAIAYRAIPKVSMFKEGSYTGCCGSDCDESGVIVKCFTPDKTQDTSKDIMREVEMLATVQRHPNVVSFCGFFRAEDADIHAMPNSSRYALMMIFCSGGDLSDIVSKGRCDFTEEDAAQKISGLLSALVHIHSRDIVHRDVKSENILFDWDGRPILADFGLACFSTDSEQMIRRCGSAGYCAPEVIMGQPYDAKVDVFGAGVVLYILLQHGHRPFRGRDVHSVLHRTVRCHVTFDRNGDCQALSDGCRRYILQLLSKKPRDRPSSSEALFQMEKNMFPDCRNDSRCLTASTTASTCGVLSAACASSSVSQSSSQAPSSSLIERSSQRSTSRSETETIAEDSVVFQYLIHG
jgi:serine/threonine protein kinase